MGDWEDVQVAGESTPPAQKKFSIKTSLTVMGVVVLSGGIFLSVMAAQQSTEQRSRAATPSDIIIDNRSAKVVGTWDTGNSAPGHYGSDYRFQGAGSGSRYLQYTPNIPQTGKYDVYAWHSQGTNRTTSAKHVISYSGGSQTISINQQSNGGKWNLLGRYTFNQGTSGNVKITDSFSGGSSIVVIADAIKFVYVGSVTPPTPTKVPPTPTRVLFPTPTKVLFPTPTRVLFPTPTRVPTAFPTPTRIPTPTSGIGGGGGPTAVPPTAIPTAVPTPTRIPSPTPTDIPEPTPTDEPTPTPEPGDTILSFTFAFHGIGTGGDNVSANAIGNMYPTRHERMVYLEIYNSSNQLVTTEDVIVRFERSSGKFKGIVNMGAYLDAGVYTMKVESEQYLRALIPGIQTVVRGNTIALPETILTGGDVNGDNALSILDYNILMGCYSDLLPATDCWGNDDIRSDLNDDGRVNQFDYNFFLRELSQRGGQ